MLINLHTHLEGRVRPSTAAELAAKTGVPTPEQGWQNAIRLDGPADLTGYLDRVACSYPFFDRAESLARITREAVEDAATDGQDYLELRLGPATHARDGFTVDDVLTAVCAGLREGTAATGLPAGLVVAALRRRPAEVNEAVAAAAARYAGNGVVGFDLAGDERRSPELAPHAGAFAIARAAGLGLTCHAAEAAPAFRAREAVELFGVRRIGHGAHIADDPHVLAWAADNGVVIEVCPTSNWYTGAIAGIADHPAPVFTGAGIGVVLGDDNPQQTGSPLSREREILSSELGFGPAELHALDLASIGAAFLDNSVRAALLVRAGQAGS